MHTRRPFPLLRVAASAAMVFALASPARAQPAAPQPETIARAEALYGEASALYLASKPAEALELFKKSYALVDSPSSSLLIARCLRDLGQPEAALEQYDHTMEQVARRLPGGDSGHADTARMAREEAAMVVARLAALEVRAVHAPLGAIVASPYVRRALPASNTAIIPHRAGLIVVSLQAADGKVLMEKTVTLVTGAKTEAVFDLTTPSPPAPPAPPPQKDEPLRVPFIATGVTSLAVGAVGFAGLIGFGLSAKSSWEDLQACTPLCQDQSDAVSQGELHQNLANAGLAIGVTGVALGVTLLIVGLTTESKPSVSIAMGRSLGVSFDL